MNIIYLFCFAKNLDIEKKINTVTGCDDLPLIKLFPTKRLVHS